MIIDLRQLEASSGRIDAVLEIAVASHAGEPVSVSFRVAVDYSQTGGSVHFHGRIEGVMETVCDRCLDPVRSAVTGAFDVVVRRSSEREPETDADEAGDYVTIPLGEHEFSLEPAIRETALVSVPMVIVCTDDCKGLCPVCGVNRNREACRCQTVEDPRWNALRRLSGGGDDS